MRRSGELTTQGSSETGGPSERESYLRRVAARPSVLKVVEVRGVRKYGGGAIEAGGRGEGDGGGGGGRVVSVRVDDNSNSRGIDVELSFD